MNPIKIKVKRRPEDDIKYDLMDYLRLRGWFVKSTHGNAFQEGFPDLYATHHVYRMRWIEVKLPGMIGSVFTSAQMRDFPLFSAHGTGIWVLTGATAAEYQKLFEPPNWDQYL